MKKGTYSLRFLLTLALTLGMLSLAPELSAQQSSAPPQDTPAQPQTPQTGQQPQQPPDQAAPQAPSSQADSPSAGHTFSGTIVKSGDKYVLKDESGASYDIDHQDQVSKFEGKKVRVTGTLDPSTKTIHIQ
jgi:uncharacterized protein YdeI (BOF family)